MPPRRLRSRPSPDHAAIARDLTVLGTALVLSFGLMAGLGPWARDLARFQILYLVAFVCFALALARAGGDRFAGPTFPRAGLLVFAVAIAARVAVLPVTPSLSDDIYRYLWEGRVVVHGGDPYRMSPADPALASLRDQDIHPRINHPELASIYPPLAIAGFALVARVSTGVMAMKSWVILHDLVLVLLLVHWARERGQSPLAVIAYAWNPLVVVEYAGSGHHDPTAIVWLVAALMWVERRPLLSALALAVGVLIKLVPLVALPFLFRRWNARARLLGVALLGAGLGWFWTATRGADSGLDAYGRAWANNELAFAYLARWVRDPALARALALGCLAMIAAWLLVRRVPAIGATRTTMRAAFLVSPVAHPWYLGWALALEPLAPSAPWLLLSATAILSYGVFAPPPEAGAFHLPLAWRWVEYGLPFLLAVALAIERRSRRLPSPG